MAIRIKMICQSVKKHKGWNSDCPILEGVEFNAITGDSGENKQFWQATPSGKVEFSTIKPAGFEVGKEYYFDITPAE